MFSNIRNNDMDQFPKPNFTNPIDINTVEPIPTGKYECISCGAVIKNTKSSIETHNKTKKHKDAIEGKPKAPAASASTAAESMRRLRERRRAELGETAFKQKQKLEKQAQRNKKKETVVEENKTKEKTNCDDVLDAMIENNQTVNKKSLLKYHKTLHRFYERFYGEELLDCSDMSWLKRDLSKFSSFILRWVRDNSRDPNNYQNSLTSTIADITSYLKRLEGYEKEYKFLSKLLKANATRRQETLEKNEPNQKQRERLIPLDELKSYSSKADEVDSTPRLLYYLYTFFPRRIQDYRLMKVIKLNKRLNTISKLQESKDYDDSFNYIVKNLNGVPYKFIFNNYKKTVKDILGVQVFEAPKEIREAVRTYIEDNDIKNNELLFGPIQSDTFSKAVSRAYEMITSLPLSVNDTRHIQATYYSSKGLSIEKLNKKANEMGQTNWVTFYSYMKKDTKT